jgi:hypothetical protein
LLNSLISAQGPKEYVPRLREKLAITDDNRWGRMCAEHALPLGWEHMEYEQFLPERRQRMADIIRVAFRLLGGESDAPAITPPWFLPGAEEVWKRIAETERALRSLVRKVYASSCSVRACSILCAAASTEKSSRGRYALVLPSPIH